MNNMPQYIGLFATVLTTACYVPQALHVVRSRNTGGISLIAYLTLFCGIILWLIYGILQHDWPIILANSVTLPLLTVVIIMKLRHK